MKIKMRKGRVLLRKAEEQKSESGIITSVAQKDKYIREVVAVGPDVTDFKIGDSVLVNHLTVATVLINNLEYGCCLEESVYGVVGQGEELLPGETPDRPEEFIV